MTIVFLVVAFIMWIAGYKYGKNPASGTGNSTLITGKIIYPPRWLFLICGGPKSQNYPEGSMILSALHSQIMGISLGVFAISVELWTPTRDEALVRFGLSVLLPYLLVAYLSIFHKPR